MADLVTRLLLNSSQFDNSIRQSTQQIQQFQTISRNITATVGKFAGILGVAMSATEIFDRAVNSSRETQQDWNTVVGTAKTTVDNFFSSLYNGDWTVFENGKLNAIGLAKRYTTALQNARMAMEIGETKADRLEAERNNIEYLITKKGISSGERTDAYNKYMELSKNEILERENKSKYFWNQFQEVLKSKGVTGIESAEQARKLYEDLIDPSTQLYKDLENYSKKKSEAKGSKRLGMLMMATGAGVGTEAIDKYTKGVEELEEVTDESLENMLRFQNIFTSDISEEMKDLIDKSITFIDKAGTIKKDMSDATQDYKDALAEQGRGTTVKTETKLEEGSIAWINEQISKKQIEFNMALNNNDRLRIQKEIDNLTRQKRTIELDLKYSQPVTAETTANPFDTSFKGLDKIESPFKKEDVKTNTDYAQSLSAIASVMGSVTNMTSEGAAAWLSWGANVVTSIASAIPAIQTMITAQTAQAGTAAVASAAQTPVVGWLLAGAAVASVLAAIASLPSFSTGGIFTGNNTIGDYNLARVNSGEMILNNRQQRNLFNLLDGSGTNKAIGGEVSFKIKGTELVGVLNNTNNRLKRLQ